MKLVFSWDDGALEDLRLFTLHEKYGIPAMFFVPTENCEGRSVLTPEHIRQAAQNPLLSFGGHTATHRYLTLVPPEERAGELAENKHYLEDILGREVPHFCLPGGKYTPEILKEVYRHYRTVRTADTMNFRNEGTLIKPTFHIYPRGKKSLLGNAWRNGSYGALAQTLLHGGTYFETIRHLVDWAAEHQPEAEIVLWGHSWEIEEQGLWQELERLMSHLSDRYGRACASYDALFV